MIIFCDFIPVFVFTTDHQLKSNQISQKIFFALTSKMTLQILLKSNTTLLRKMRVDIEIIYSRLLLSRSQRDSLKYFDI